MEEKNKEKIEKPKHIKLFMVLGPIFIVAGIVLDIIAMINMSNFEDDHFFLFFIGLPLIFFGVIMTTVGYSPYIVKLQKQTERYTQEIANKELKDVAKNTADIGKEGVVITAKAIKEGLFSEDEVFCKFCGKSIDKDSIFCKHCGKNIKE